MKRFSATEQHAFLPLSGQPGVSNIDGRDPSTGDDPAVIRAQAYAKASLIGDPSDWYFGKVIAITVRNFSAQVALWESDKLIVLPELPDAPLYSSLDDLLRSIETNGYYGGMRLVKAMIKRFVLYCHQNSIALAPRNFTIRYESDIPRRAGLAGSSAIAVAVLRALMRFYGVSIPVSAQPGLVMAAERDELGIEISPHDAIIQVNEGVMFMNFDRDVMARRDGNDHQPLAPSLLPPLFIAYDRLEIDTPSVFAGDIQERLDQGDPDTLNALLLFSNLAERAQGILLAGRSGDLGPLMSQSTIFRRRLVNLSPRAVQMIEIGRRLGAHVKFAGCGGAAIGTYTDETMFARLAAAYRGAEFEVIKPKIVE